jgi:hypothetical protein
LPITRRFSDSRRIGDDFGPLSRFGQGCAVGAGFGVACSTYRLMPNPARLIPASDDSAGLALAMAHRL